MFVQGFEIILFPLWFIRSKSFLQSKIYFIFIPPLLPLQHCSNLLSISSIRTFTFEWKSLILHIFFQFESRCSNCNYFYQLYKIEGCSCEYQVDLPNACSMQGLVVGFNLSLATRPHTQKFSKIFLKRSMRHVFPCVVFFASSLVLRLLKHPGLTKVF